LSIGGTFGRSGVEGIDVRSEDDKASGRPEHDSGVPSTASTETPRAPDQPIGDFEPGNDPTGGGSWVRRRLPLPTLEGADDASNAVLQLPGVARAAVESNPPELVIDMEPGVLSDDELAAALGRGGIEATEWTDEPIPAAERGGRRPTNDVPSTSEEQSALVDEASEESFPASDPPSYWGRSAGDRATR